MNKIRSRSREYEFFIRFQPVAMVRYSVYIYHSTKRSEPRASRTWSAWTAPSAVLRRQPPTRNPLSTETLAERQESVPSRSFPAATRSTFQTRAPSGVVDGS